MESYGAYKLVDPRSTADAHAHKIFETTTLHNGQRYDVGMVWADDNFQLTNNYFSSLVQLKSPEKRLSRDKTSKENYAETIDEDLQKGYVITVPDAHMVAVVAQRLVSTTPSRNQPEQNDEKCVGYYMVQQSFTILL